MARTGSTLNERERHLAARERILDAARDLFYEKGLEGARMQEIADRAGINKAMLHYYFKSKDQLFAEVMEEALARLTPIAQRVLQGPGTIAQRLEWYIEEHTAALLYNPYIPMFVLTTFSRSPGQLPFKFPVEHFSMQNFVGQWALDVAEGRISPQADMFSTWVTLISLVTFPHVGRPGLMQFFGMSEEAWQQMVVSRQQHIKAVMACCLNPGTTPLPPPLPFPGLPAGS